MLKKISKPSLPKSPKNNVGKYDGQACPAIVFSHILFGHQQSPLHRIPEPLVPDIMDACVFYFVSAPCHGTTQHLATKGGVKWEGLFIYIIIHELKTHTLVEVVEELLRGVKGFGGWVFVLYQNILSNIFHSNISNIFHKNIHMKKGKT